MFSVTDVSKYENIIDNNIIIGSPKLNSSEIKFFGKDNILFCEDGVSLNKSNIAFQGSNSVIYIGKNNISIDVIVFNNSVFRFGKNAYINGKLSATTSEEKHIFFGDDCMLSFGVFIRVADPHLIYNTKSFNRVNPSKSVFVGDHVWIGQSVLLLKGTQIFSGSIIGGNSVVAGKAIPSNTSWAGNPAKQIGENVFWDPHCVHSWTSAETEKFKIFDKGEIYIYNSCKNSLSFEDIDKSLTSACTSSEKLNILKQIAENTNKCRFAFQNESKVCTENG